MAFEFERILLFMFVVNGLCWIEADAFEKYSKEGSELFKSTFDLDQFRQDLLKATNEKRALHGVPPMQLRDDINDYAQEWAEHIGNEWDFSHRPNAIYGENLASATPWESASSVVQRWYREIDNYNYITHEEKIDDSKMIGHFTMLVWRNSKYLGVGAAFLNTTRAVAWYVVANYDPPGNYGGLYRSNVPLPIHGHEDFHLNLDQYRNDILQAINRKRALHGVPPLALNSKVTDFDQSRAEWFMTNNRYQEYYLNSKHKFFEILSTCIGCPATFHIDRLYNEINNFNFTTYKAIDSAKKYHGFMAIIWRSIQYLGVGVAYDDSSKLMIVAIGYIPVEGMRSDNVLPPTSSK